MSAVWSRGWPGGWTGSWSPRRTAAAWAASRAVLIALVVHPHLIGAQQDVLGDVRLYAGWGRGLVHGAGLPSGDHRWQYPPGAAAVLAVPAALARLTGVGYLTGLVAVLLLVDALLVAGLRGWRGPDAGRYWVLGVLALGPVAFARFDLVPAALAAAGLIALIRGRPGLAGVALGLGAAVKVWPLLLVVPALARTLEPGGEPAGQAGGEPGGGGDGGRARSSVWLLGGVAAAWAAVAALVAAAGWTHGAGGFLSAQGARGLQLEAVPALPFVAAHLLGAGPGPTYAYGSLQFAGPAARAVATACSVVEALVVVAAAAVWWWRAGSARAVLTVSAVPVRPDAMDPIGGTEAPAQGDVGDAGAAGGAGDAGDPGDAADADDRMVDRALALVLLVVLTSRVLSPQYLLWVLALAAARYPVGRLERRDDRDDARWRAAMLIVGAALLSQVIYPMRYNDLVQGRVVAGLLLVARDVLLITALGYAARAARGSRGPLVPRGPRVVLGRRPPPASPAGPPPRRGRRSPPASDVPAGTR